MKYPMYAAAAQNLVEAGHSEDTQASGYWVPGRIEVVGKVLLACSLHRHC